MADNIRKILDEIIELVGNGKVIEAGALCRKALKTAPDDVSLVAMMGAIHFGNGEFDEAEQFLCRAVELEPSFFRAREDLGALYLAKEQFEQAAPQFRRAMAIDPHSASAVRGLAAALQHMGREDEAEELRRGFLQTLPTEVLLAEAEAHCGRGATSEAEQICDVVLERDPESIGALRVLAMAATKDERHVVAEGYLKRIARLAPQEAGALLDIGRFLHERGRFPEAIEYLQSAEQLSPDNPEVQLTLGNMYAIVGRTGDALRAYEKCLHAKPDDTAALVGRGHILRIEGRQDEARESYQRCVQVDPGFGTAWWYLASLHRYSASDDDVKTMQAQLDDETLAPESVVGLHFALARAAEKREDFDDAWRHYEQGNARKRALVRYDPVKSELEQAKIRTVFTPDLLARGGARPDTDATPIFILGMPRSGSTLIEQILASHSQIEGTGELPFILMMTASMVTDVPGTLHYTELVGGMSDEALTRLGNNYLTNSLAYRGEGKPFFTDKMPANFPHVGFIRMILPHAKIIDARRDPMATCVANYRQLFAQGKNQSYDLIELGEYYVQYVMMMEHWDKVMPGAVLRVQYEDVVSDLESQVRRILDHCGLGFEEACIDYHKSDRPVNTASAEQVREPIYRSAVEFWRNFEPRLDELREVLAPIL